MKYARLICSFTRSEIAALFHSAQRIFVDDSLTILIAPQMRDYARLLIVASRSVGTSPARHKIRRRLKHIFYQERLFGRLNCDVAVIVKAPACAFSFDDLRKKLLDILARHLCSV